MGFGSGHSWRPKRSPLHELQLQDLRFLSGSAAPRRTSDGQDRSELLPRRSQGACLLQAPASRSLSTNAAPLPAHTPPTP